MKTQNSFPAGFRLGAGLALGLVLGPMLWAPGRGIIDLTVTKAHAAEPAPKPATSPDDLKTELAAIKGKLPDQSHAMKDVGYHFANLWCAGQQENWPLARFYLDETRSHLRWAVRIIPVRKVKAGDLELKGILDA